MATRDLEGIGDLVFGDIEFLSQLFAGGLTLILLLELREGLGDLVQRTDLVEGKAYDTSLLSQSLEDRLTDPPYCVGDELEASGLIELLSSLDQAQVALVDQVGQAQALVLVLLSH